MDRGAWKQITLGLSDRAREGNFVWEQSGEKPTFTNWLVGEPNNLNQNEDCVELKSDGGWNDIPCGNLEDTIIICEKLLPKSKKC